MAQTERLVTVGPQGRIAIPAAVRRDLDLEEGTTLAVRVEGRRLILETRGEILDRLRKRYADAGAKGLSRELIADRRDEARRESRR
ncbi:MAG: AbrB/MazE/SpoVT family DNA-binding domain-containing protein [Actinomycetota bacterium]